VRVLSVALSRLAIVSMARFRVLTACDVDCGCVPSVRFIYRFYSLNFQFQSISASNQPADQPSIRPSNPTHPSRYTHRHRSALRSIRRRASSCGVCDCDRVCDPFRSGGVWDIVCACVYIWWCGGVAISIPLFRRLASSLVLARVSKTISLRLCDPLCCRSRVLSIVHPIHRIRACVRSRVAVESIESSVWCGVVLYWYCYAVMRFIALLIDG
jgi:hypothetical protein